MNEELGKSAQSFVNTIYSDECLLHPPYNLEDGKLKPQQVNRYHMNNYAPSYTDGYVLCRDDDFAEETSRFGPIYFSPDQLPSRSELEPFLKFPQECAVSVAEMRNGTGDIFEAISCALELARRDINITIVMPRDKSTYQKTKAVLESTKNLIQELGINIIDYHECFEKTPFDLTIYPSTQRTVGSIPSHISILLGESGESLYRSHFSWNSEKWGGITIGLNTGFNPGFDQYGAIGPLFSSSELDEYTPTPDEQKVLSQIRSDIAKEKEIVIVYPGSNDETKAQDFLTLYSKLIERSSDNRDFLAIIPGSIDIKLPHSDKIEFVQIGQVSNQFLCLLMHKYISKTAPSLVAGSMSLVEAMYFGIPFFYKSELWKKGNLTALTRLLEDSGLTPIQTEGARSKGILKNTCFGEGSPVNILSYEEVDDLPKQEYLSARLAALISSSQERLAESMFCWFGLLSRVSRSNPSNISEYFNSLGRSEKISIQM